MKPPKMAKAMKDELGSLIGCLIKRGISNDQNFPVLRSVTHGSSSVWEVTFSGAEYVSIGMEDIGYTEIYERLLKERSYTAKLIDGGLLQLMYQFKCGGDLLRHRLAYYPSPELPPFREDPESYQHDEPFVDIVKRRIVPFPLRFDFNEVAARDVTHPMCHLTLGDVKGCRIPVSAPLAPRLFIEFVLRNFYQTNKHNFACVLPKRGPHFGLTTITVSERRLIHVVVPT